MAELSKTYVIAFVYLLVAHYLEVDALIEKMKLPYRRIDIKPDGDCFFTSIASVLNKSAREVREVVVHEMSNKLFRTKLDLVGSKAKLASADSSSFSKILSAEFLDTKVRFLNKLTRILIR
jgi:hypothetical protein